MNSIAAVRSFNSAEPAWAQACAVIDASGADVAVATTSAGAVFAAASESAIARDDAAGVVIAADASLVDRDSLLHTLELSPDATDAQVILRAYLKWGRECAAHLMGDFAFVVGDGRSGELLAARDLMGVRPLYCRDGGDGSIAFSSTLRGLSTTATATAIDERHLAAFVLGQDNDRGSTFYRDIRRIPAGHSMQCSSGGSMLQAYWSPDDIEPVELSGDGEYADAFRSLFLVAVMDRLSEDGVAAALSGGLDSSAIVCAAREMYGWRSDRLHAISLVFPDLPPEDLGRIDERAFIGSVTEAGGLRALQVRGDRMSPLDDVAHIIDVLDEPFAAPNLYLHRGMYAAASSAGTRVFLDGFDGDSVVGHGLHRLERLLAAGSYEQYRDEVRRFAARRGVPPASVVRLHGLPYLRSLARERKLVQWARLAQRFHTDFSMSRRELYRDHGPGLRDFDATTAGALALLDPDLASLRSGAADETDSPVAGLMRPVFQTTLELASRTARVYNLEPAYPFFDRRLMEFCMGLPDEQRFHDGWTRIVMRRALEGILPPAIQWRAAKSNLTPAFVRGMRTDDVALVRDVDFHVLADYVRVDVLDAMRREALDGGWERIDLFLLFRMITLAIWMGRSAHSRTTPPAGRERVRSLVETSLAAV